MRLIKNNKEFWIAFIFFSFYFFFAFFQNSQDSFADPFNTMHTYVVDPTCADSGVTTAANGKRSIKDFLTLIDANPNGRYTLVFYNSGSGATTAYTISTAIDLTAYPGIYFDFRPGAQLNLNANLKIYDGGHIMAPCGQLLKGGGSGSLLFAYNNFECPGWSSGSTTFKAASAEIASYGSAVYANASTVAKTYPTGQIGNGGHNLAFMDQDNNFTCNYTTFLSDDPSTYPISLTVSGSTNASDSVGFNWSGTKSGVTFDFDVTYTTQAGDSLSDIADGILAALKASSDFEDIVGYGYAYTAYNSGTILYWNNWWPLNTTSAVSGITSAATTITIGGGSTALELASYISVARNVSGRTPEANDMIGGLLFIGGDTVGAVNTQYIDMICKIASPTDGTERGELYIQSNQNNGLVVSDGIYTTGSEASASGGYMGPGTANFKHYYQDGLPISGTELDLSGITSPIISTSTINVTDNYFAVNSITDEHLAGYRLNNGGGSTWHNSINSSDAYKINYHDGVTWKNILTLDQNGNLALDSGTTTGKLKIVEDTVGTLVYLDNYSSTTTTANNLYLRSSTTDIAETNSQTWDQKILGTIIWQGNSGSAFTNGAYIQSIQDGAASTYTPTFIRFGTSPGSSNFTERMRLDKNGNLGIAQTAPAAVLDVNGAAKFSSSVRQQRSVYSGTTHMALSGVSMAASAIFELTGSASATFTLDSGTNLSAAISGVATGDSIQFIVKNSSTGTITMAGGTGTTLSSAMTVATLQTRIFTAVCTGANTWTIY